MGYIAETKRRVRTELTAEQIWTTSTTWEIKIKSTYVQLQMVVAISVNNLVKNKYFKSKIEACRFTPRDTNEHRFDPS